MLGGNKNDRFLTKFLKSVVEKEECNENRSKDRKSYNLWSKAKTVGQNKSDIFTKIL